MSFCDSSFTSLSDVSLALLRLSSEASDERRFRFFEGLVNLFSEVRLKSASLSSEISWPM